MMVWGDGAGAAAARVMKRDMWTKMGRIIPDMVGGNY